MASHSTKDAWPPEWPYDWTAAEARLSPDMIERQGAFLLSRALNIRRLVVFLGSGTSIPYGRVSWSELAKTHIDLLQKAHKTLQGRGKEKLKATPGARSKPIEALNDLVADLEQFGKLTRSSADENMLALQLCEQYWTMTSDEEDLKQLACEFGLSDDFENLKAMRQPELGRRLMRVWIARETFDEFPHVKRVLTGALGDKNFEDALGKHLPPPVRHGLAPDPSIASYIDATRSRLPISSAEMAERLQRIREKIKSGLTAAGLPDLNPLLNLIQDDALPPTRYYIMGLLLDLLRAADPQNAHDLLQDGAAYPQKAHLLLQDLARVTSQRSIPDEVDVLKKFIFKLDVSRFLTTNYDIEFERLLRDLGFVLPTESIAQNLSPAVNEQVGPLGGKTRAVVLGEKTGVDLIDFALHDSDYTLQLLHLHGCSTEPAGLVVTERDYKLKYVRDTDQQKIYREGLDLAFGGNPILFAGVGMGEGDVLRPLREFAASLSRRNHSLIALRPASDAKADRDLFTMQQYSRYGVHIIHYGFLSGDPTAPDRAESWLEKIIGEAGHIGFLKTVCKDADVLDKEDTRKKIDDICSALGKGPAPKGEWRKFISDGGSCNIEADVTALRVIANIVKSLIDRSTDCPIRAEARSKLIKETIPQTLDRLAASITTCAFAAKLEGLSRDWMSWWDRWRDPLGWRDDQAQYFADERAITGHSPIPNTSPIVFHRHKQNDEIFKLHSDTAPPSDPHYEAFKDLTIAKRDGRRIFFIPGQRGKGKGHVFSTFRENCRNLVHLYEAQLYLALSFSNEVSSVFNQIIRFIRAGTQYQSHFEDTAGPEGQVDQPGRASELRRALKERAQRPGRLLIVINSFDNLFHSDGRPRTAEIGELLEILLGSEGDDSHLDIVALTRTSRIPIYYRDNASKGNDVPFLGPLTVYPIQSLDPRDIDSRSEISRLKKAGAELVVSTPDRGGYCIVCEFANKIEHLRQQEVWRGFAAWLKPIEEAPDVEELVKKLVEGKYRRHHKGLVLAVLADIWSAEKQDQTKREEIKDFLSEIEHYYGSRDGSDSSDPSGEILLELVYDYWYQRNAKSSRCEYRGDGSDNCNDPALHEKLIRHLSVIGIPIESRVLCSCPQLSNYNATAINQALELLAQRGLVFQIHAHQRADDNCANKRHRYAVHRTIQHYIYRRLGEQRKEPADSLLFAPSLAVAQTSGYAQLGPLAYAFIYDLVDKLVCYPGRVTLSRDIPTLEEIEDYNQNLRAGLGVVRNLFSVGIVSRLHDLEGLEVPLPPKLGHFEHHRKVLRWMIRFAGYLERAAKNIAAEAAKQPWLPYYKDEIVWLYNECGVFSLVQGELYDAQALLSMALKNCREIEGSSDGPTGRRVKLNLAQCLLDRGRLDAAERRLKEILATCGRDDLLVPLSEGNLAIIEGIRGNYSIAEELYERSLHTLRIQKRHRPIGLFERRRGDLLRSLGKSAEAEAAYMAAIRAATAGGNIDHLHSAHVSLARLQAQNGKADEAVRRLLDEATNYADTMELPMLKAEAVFVRGEILLQSGETTLAAQFATRALRIATLYGLTLRKTAYSDLLARVYRKRGDVEAADILFSKTLKSARGQGYHVLADRIQSTLSNST